MNPFHTFKQNITRRHFFAAGSHAMGYAALTSLLGEGRVRADAPPAGDPTGIGAALPRTHFPAKTRNIAIGLFAAYVIVAGGLTAIFGGLARR